MLTNDYNMAASLNSWGRNLFESVVPYNYCITVQNWKQSKTMSVLVDRIQTNVCYCCRWKIQDVHTNMYVYFNYYTIKKIHTHQALSTVL